MKGRAIRMHFGGEPVGLAVLWQMGQGRIASRTTPTPLTEVGQEGTGGSNKSVWQGINDSVKIQAYGGMAWIYTHEVSSWPYILSVQVRKS